MSFQDLQLHLQEVAKKLDDQMPEVLEVQIMHELEAEWKERIFGNGLNSDGSKIGEYSTNPSYYTKEAFIRTTAFKPQGKINKGNFKNGKQRKSMFLVGGYSEFRKIQGRQNEFVNLKYSGSLERAFRVYKFGNSVLFGNASEPEHLKFTGMEDKFGEFGSLSETEKTILKESIAEHATIIAK